MRAPRLPLLAALLLAAAPAAAEPLIYEGELAGLPDGAETVDLRFAIHAAEAGGAPVWSSGGLTLAVSPAGRFVAELERSADGRMLQPYHFAGSRWLEVTVLPPGRAPVTLAPRQRIGWTPTAYDPTIKGRADDGVFLISVHCGGGAHAEGAMERFDDLHAAVRWLDDKRIAEGTTVRIAVRSDCTLREELRIDHPQGQRIELVGDPDGLEPPILRFEQSPPDDGDGALDWSPFTNGIVVGFGHRLGLVRGFRIHREPEGPDGPTSWGLRAENGGVIFADDLTVRGFSYGVTAELGGAIIDPEDDTGPLIAHANGTGFRAGWGGLIRASRAEAHGNHGPGMSASGNGTLDTAYAVAQANEQSGFAATHGGVMRLVHSQAEENAHHGFLANRNGHLYADYTLSRGNTRQGYMSSAGGSMDASISAAEGNGVGYYAVNTGVISASRSYSQESATSAVLADRQGLIYFRCGEWSDREGELNPGGPRAGPYISLSDPGADGVQAAIYAHDEGVIDALGCPGDAQGVEVDGRRLTNGYIAHPEAAAACCEAP